jgi:hypothetical protein
MRVLLVGTSPPPGGPAAVETALEASALAAAGHEVEVLSPDPRSAAHHHAPLSGARLGVQLALRARRFDALVLRLQPGLPLSPAADRLSRALSLALLGLALRGYREVTLRLPSPIPLPGGVGGRATWPMWSAVTRVVVASEEDRDRLRAAPGLSGERIEVEPAGTPPGAEERSWRSLDCADPDLRLSVQAVVRAKAIAGRCLERVGASAGARPSGAEEVWDDPFSGASAVGARPRVGELAGLLADRLRRAR